MHKTLLMFRCFAGRFKFIGAVATIFLAGTLLATGTSAYYYDAALARQQGAYERQIARIESDLLLEREVNRDRIEAVAVDIDSIVDSIGRLITMVTAASRTASTAASTAKAAAATAQGAAQNAAQANITVTEIEPAKPKKSPFPERIEP